MQTMYSDPNTSQIPDNNFIPLPMIKLSLDQTQVYCCMVLYFSPNHEMPTFFLCIHSIAAHLFAYSYFYCTIFSLIRTPFSIRYCFRHNSYKTQKTLEKIVKYDTIKTTKHRKARKKNEVKEDTKHGANS